MLQFIKKIESKILTKLFMRWVKDEWDIELLQLTAKLIEDRTVSLQRIVDAYNHVEVKGFRAYKEDGKV